MNEEKARETLLQINYSKLLGYVGVALVSFFTLFQIVTEAMNRPVFTFFISSAACIAIYIFTRAGFNNYKEIINLENLVGISEILNPSGYFSVRISDDSTDRKVAPTLNRLGLAFIVFAVTMAIYPWHLSGFFEL